MSKVYSIVMKVRLDCPTCQKKITKALCSVCICDLQTKNFDEKENTVTITGTFDPEKFMKKISRKVGKFILSYEVNEISVKKEARAPKKETAAKGEKPAEDKKKAKNDDKDDDKKKGDDKKKDPAPKADDKEPEKSAPKPAAPAAAMIETPAVATEVYSIPAIGAPASWGYYGQYPYGYYPKSCQGVHERPPYCSCGSSHGQNHYGQQSAGFFSEEDSTCTVM
ncbi:uncharacterized protein LOC116259111 [Nymphaea colorata]|nr:uncharacterized protein LOC116259111 [Nymphaea colorata]